MASAVRGMLSAGISGMTLIHADDGGYTAADIPLHPIHRGPELLERWNELAVFAPLMRTHEGNHPEENTQVYDSPATMACFARMTRLYAALAGYRLQAERQARRGIPLLRPMWLADPHGPFAGDDKQFFFGDSFLVAPVVAPGATTVSVDLPAGRWTLLWSGEHYGDPARPSTVNVPAPPGSPAVLYRAGDPAGAGLRAKLPQITRASGAAARGGC
jgi:alpha-glucosidase